MGQRSIHPRGFTLIELILVLLVLTIMVGLAAPRMSGFGIGRKSAQVASQLVSLAQYARSKALGDGVTTRLVFDLPGRSFSVKVIQDGAYVAASSEHGDDVTLPDGMSLQTDIPQRDDGTYVEFRPDGRCEPAKIYLTDILNQTIEVACPSATELFHVIKPGEVDQ